MDTELPSSSGPELKEYTALLRRRWRLVGTGVLGGLLLATTGAFAMPSTYTSVTAVQVHPTGMAEFTGERSGRLTGEVNLDSEAQVVISDRVAGVAAGELPEPLSPRDMRENIDVTVPPNSNILELHYSARTPELAREGAETLATTYLEHRGEQARDLIDGHLEALREEQRDRYDSLTELTSSGPGEGGQAGAQAQADALRQEIGDLGNGISPLSALRETVSPGQVITPAHLPESASSPIVPLWSVTGTALGLLVGLSTALVRDRLDPRLHDAEDTARLGGLPVLLDLSAPKARRDRFFGLLTDATLDGQRANAFAHLIRARPAGNTPSENVDEEPAPGRVIMVTGTAPGRSGTAAAVNLAAALGRSGATTLLVCADPSTDTVVELLGLTEGPGLAEVLINGEDPSDLAVSPAEPPRLRVLRHGSSDDLAPLQGGATELVDLLRTRAEFVVIATASSCERADAHALAASVDLLLPVVESGRTRRRDLIALCTAASRLGVAVPGSIIVPRQPEPDPVPTPPRPVPPAPRPPSEEATAVTGRKDGSPQTDPRTCVSDGAASAGSRP